MSKQVLYTVGHSNRTIDEFIELLCISKVTAIADVRSQPYSRRFPHFNRDQLKESLQEHGIMYVFLGDELGARRNESSCYVDGQAKYGLIEKTPSFQFGLNRIRKGIQTHCIAIMCAEKDPLTCHRSILIAKSLRHELDIGHIIAPDEIEPHHQAEKRLMTMWDLNRRDLFQDHACSLEDAYERQAREIAYVANGFVSATEVNRNDD